MAPEETTTRPNLLPETFWISQGLGLYFGRKIVFDTLCAIDDTEELTPVGGSSLVVISGLLRPSIVRKKKLESTLRGGIKTRMNRRITKNDAMDFVKKP